RSTASSFPPYYSYCPPHSRPSSPTRRSSDLSYMACDGLAEFGGSLFGKQKIKVPGIGDVNRKSIGGTVSGFVGALVLCLWVVQGDRKSKRLECSDGASSYAGFCWRKKKKS